MNAAHWLKGWGDIAAQVQVDPKTAKRYADWQCEHRLPVRRMGGSPVITVAAIHEWFAQLPNRYCPGCGSVRWR
jgi:hypothetical protein